MSIFDKDRIGVKVFCKVVHGSIKNRDEAVEYGYVRWTHAIVGQVIQKIETVNRGLLKGPWIVEKINIPFTTKALGNNI